MSYKIAHEIHPNNETRLTLYRVRPKSLSLIERAAECLGVSGSEVEELARSVPTPDSTLDIRPEFRTNNSNKSLHSHARTVFGLNAKRRIFRAGGALDRFDADVTSYMFLTATLPGNTSEAKWAIAEYAHEIIDGLKSWLSKRLQDRKEFYVWEHQDRGALHFHYCIYCPDKKVQEEITRNFKRQMVRLYDGIDKKHDCNLWGRWANKPTRYRVAILQARVEVVYQSVAAYMAGYLGGKKDKHARDSHYPDYPKRWFGVSRPLCALIESYTEKEEYEFTTIREASETFEKLGDDLLDESLTHKKYPHKIGEGKTQVFYHTYETQQILWQSRKMLNHNQTTHPVISNYVNLALRTTQELRQCLERFKSLRERLPLNCRLSLSDSTFPISMRNGALSQKQITILEKTFCSYDFASDSRPAIQKCFHNLRTFNLLTARYHPQMRFNRYGFLNNENDFSVKVDDTGLVCYRGTTAEEPETPTALDSSSGHVPREPPGLPIQYEQCRFLD